MPAFEYETMVANWGHDEPVDGIRSRLNELGAQGWELVGMSRDESADDDHDEEVVLFVLKRERKGRAAPARKAPAKAAAKTSRKRK